MNTIILSPHDESLYYAASVIKQHQIVAFPTETVYGLGASIFDQESIHTIYVVKGRQADNPLIAHVSSRDQIHRIAKEIPKDFFRLADAFFPGPLTLVVPKHTDVPDIASANLSTIGIRMPKHPIAIKLIDIIGEPLVAPSANLSGKPSPTTAQDVYEDLHDKIPLILDGGACAIGIESTVLDLTVEPYTILRPGHITKDQLETVLKQPIIASATTSQIKAPGMKYRHYAPKTPIHLIHSLQELKEPSDDVMILTNAHLPLQYTHVYPLTETSLYSLFREADRKKFSKIVIVIDNTIVTHAGIMNRISKASKGI